MARGKAIVVDDHRALAENIADVLRGGIADLDCTIAAASADAIAFADASLDVAFVDLKLPDVSGVELIHVLRERAPFAQVVVVTGNASMESAVGALDRGAFSYVTKPFAPDDLIEKGRRAIERARLLREREDLRLELERSERRHRSIIESVPACVAALDAAGRIRLWNHRLEELTGFSREEMLGTDGRNVIGTSDGDHRLSMKGGGHRLVRWSHARLGPTPGTDEQLTFAVGVDVTEERETQRRAARTERLVAVGTLAAGLAHEVRNPLNSASLQLQVLERRLARGETKPEALQSVVGIVHNEIRRLDRLVNEFLAFARPSPLHLQPVALNDVVGSVVRLVQPECEASSLGVTLELAPEVGRIQADEERLRQVFLNIVRNAVEAMAEGGGTLRVFTHPADHRGFVRVDVEDSGPGFSENAPIFDAFYTTKENGTGLGLSIVHSIVNDHGGTIQVESQPGRTRFTISLPQPGADPESDA